MKPVASIRSTAKRLARALPALPCLALLIAYLSVPTSSAMAQDLTSQTVTPPNMNKMEAARTNPLKSSTESKLVSITKPGWADLTPAQHKALKPLADQWAHLSIESKRKWLALSKNYDALPSAEQAKLHSRMSDWVSLSQQQRTEARLNFAETKKLPADEKAAHWQSYQELSAEEKQKLAAQAPVKTPGVAVVKPIAQKKLAEVPVTPHAPKQGAKLAGPNQAVNQNTLLPQRPASADATSPPKQ